ncbi:hypothetical protein HDA31_006147 [Micromonospora carbonacea subsp. aurantiaca]|nr:hypothetical protein [Micromonospora carbonacea]
MQQRKLVAVAADYPSARELDIAAGSVPILKVKLLVVTD